jgi:hypothetical protein
MDGLLIRHVQGAILCIEDRPALKVRNLTYVDQTKLGSLVGKIRTKSPGQFDRQTY